MIFKIFFPLITLTTLLISNEYKYKLALNDDCINHYIETKENNSSANVYSATLCDYYKSSETIFLITKSLNYGKNHYLNSFSSDNGFFLGYSGGLGEGEFKTYGQSQAKGHFAQLEFRGGYEREVSQGFTLSIITNINHYHLLTSDVSIHKADKESYKQDLNNFQSGKAHTELRAFFALGLKF